MTYLKVVLLTVVKTKYSPTHMVMKVFIKIQPIAE